MGSHPRCQRGSKGLTLVEVIVTLAIVAVLLAILVPTLLTARARARNIICAANLKALGGLLQVYAGENGGLQPPNVNSPSPGRSWYDRGRIGRYAGGSLTLPSGLYGGGILACPDDQNGQRSYAMNVWASAEVDAWRLTDPSLGSLWRRRMRSPERVVLLVESWSYLESEQLGFFAPAVVGYRGETAGKRFGAGGGVVPFSAGRYGMVNCELPYQRHRRNGDGGTGQQPFGRVNIAYADGHVALKSNADLVEAETGKTTGDTLWAPQDESSAIATR